MRKAIGCIAAFALILTGCWKGSDTSTAASTQAPSSAPAASAPPATTPPAPTPPAAEAAPSHNYSMAESDGTYGYEPALSEDDVRAGKATKALEMMRYVGNRNGTYVILLLGTDASDTEISNRVSCQSPCNYAKSETLARVVFGALVTTVVRKTETIRVAPDSIIGAMLADAISGHLKPYGQGSGNTMPQAQFVPSATTPTATEANVPAQAQQSVGGDASAPQTSFDCSKPGTVAQYLICGDSALATSDRELADLVQQARNAVQDQAGFGERIKKQWNYREKNCKDKPCLAAWYAYEKDIMTKIAQSGDVNAK